MATVFKIMLMVVLLGIFSGCAYDPAYAYNESDNYYGTGNRSPYYSNAGYGYSNRYYTRGYPQSDYYNHGYRNGRYCPDDD